MTLVNSFSFCLRRAVLRSLTGEAQEAATTVLNGDGTSGVVAVGVETLALLILGVQPIPLLTGAYTKPALSYPPMNLTANLSYTSRLPAVLSTLDNGQEENIANSVRANTTTNTVSVERKPWNLVCVSWRIVRR